MPFGFTLFGRKEKASSSVAKDRLLEVLIHDRIKLPPATMEQIRKEILEVLSRYIDVDTEGMEFTLTRTDGADQLKANIPIRRCEAFDRLKADGDEEAPAASNLQPSAPARSSGSAPASRHSGTDARTFGPPRKKRH